MYMTTDSVCDTVVFEVAPQLYIQGTDDHCVENKEPMQKWWHSGLADLAPNLRM